MKNESMVSNKDKNFKKKNKIVTYNKKSFKKNNPSDTVKNNSKKIIKNKAKTAMGGPNKIFKSKKLIRKKTRGITKNKEEKNLIERKKNLIERERKKRLLRKEVRRNLKNASKKTRLVTRVGEGKKISLRNIRKFSSTPTKNNGAKAYFHPSKKMYYNYFSLFKNIRNKKNTLKSRKIRTQILLKIFPKILIFNNTYNVVFQPLVRPLKFPFLKLKKKYNKVKKKLIKKEFSQKIKAIYDQYYSYSRTEKFHFYKILKEKKDFLKEKKLKRLKKLIQNAPMKSLFLTFYKILKYKQSLIVKRTLEDYLKLAFNRPSEVSIGII